MAVFPCSRDYQFSVWDGVAISFLGAGVTALAVTNLYKPDFFTKYKLPMMISTGLTPVASFAVGRILNWPIQEDDGPTGRLEKHRETVDKWDALRPGRGEPSPTAEQQDYMKTFLNNCSKGEIAAILHHHPKDFDLVKIDVDATKLADAFEVLFDGGEGETFWNKIRGEEGKTVDPTCRKLISSLHPTTLASILEAHPSDIATLEKAVKLPLDAIVLLTSEEAMNQWIITKSPGDLTDHQIMRLFKEMLPPIPEGDIKEKWEPDATPAFLRLIREHDRIPAIYDAISTPDQAMVVAVLLGDQAMGEYITKTSLLSFGPGARDETPTKEKALGKLLGKDWMLRARGIKASVERLLLKKGNHDKQIRVYLKSCATTWQSATLYALGSLKEKFEAKKRFDLFRKVIKDNEQGWKSLLEKPETLASVLFDKDLLQENETFPGGWLKDLANTLNSLGADLSKSQRLRVALLREAYCAGRTGDQLREFLDGLRPTDRKAFIGDIQAASNLVQVLCEWSGAAKLVKKITPEQGGRYGREVIIDYFRELARKSGKAVPEIGQCITTQKSFPKRSLKAAIPFADLACYRELLQGKYTGQGAKLGCWVK